jgi:hypothetical protein
MTLQINIPDSLVRQARELAERQHVSVDQVVATALTAQIASAPARIAIAERARRVNWRRVEDILSRVSARPPQRGDE